MGARVDTTHNPLRLRFRTKELWCKFFQWGWCSDIYTKYIYVIVEAFWGGGGGVGNVIVHVLFRPGAISLHTSCDTKLRHM